ncbi:hypothetical protein [Prosthecobacter vanneervenii]|uniref:Uncharacterized protein n=1 Tax=Prosthecobacter vanneervenii TaxID=48466 RepID=A0A7W7YFT3_9BACT|nr:hypothetical protein [Prosthecobacter vanneervenii]MBB5035217.1 hypothetical protein [Prosthecobacter vanneervenii]
MRRLPFLCSLLLATGASAQQPAPTAPAAPPPPTTAAPQSATRLQQMESIYQKELSTRHIPLLGKYLLELQRQAAVATDKKAYTAEIARVQQIINSGGVLDLIATQQAQAGTMPMPAPMPAPPPPEQKQALITLSPALAQEVVPKPPADSQTATVGEIAWRMEFIAAGTYDILLHYSCPDLKEPLKLRIECNGQVIEKDLEVERGTSSAQTFRILRLGSLALTSDLRGETLRLTAGDKASPQLILKSLLVTRPRPPASTP